MESFDPVKAMRGLYDETPGTAECEKHGGYALRLFSSGGHFLGRLPRVCPKCTEQAQIDRRVKEQVEAIRERVKLAGVPQRFCEASFDEFEPSPELIDNLDEVRAFTRALIEGERSGRSLMLLGRCGTGKTHLATAAVRAVLAGNGTARYTKVADMIREIRATWAKNSAETEGTAMRRFTDTRLLVLDEVGVSQSASESEVGLVSDIVDTRYGSCLPTIVISNRSYPELAKYLGERVLDRLVDRGGKVLIFSGPSYRKSRAA